MSALLVGSMFVSVCAVLLLINLFKMRESWLDSACMGEYWPEIGTYRYHRSVVRRSALDLEVPRSSFFYFGIRRSPL